MRAVDICSFKGYFFHARVVDFCWNRFERFPPDLNLSATWHRLHYVCRGGSFVYIILTGPLAVFEGCFLSSTTRVASASRDKAYCFPGVEVRNAARLATHVSTGAIAVVLSPDLSKTLSCVRPCTDTFGHKALGFLIIEHFQFNSILAISPQVEGSSLSTNSKMRSHLG